ncbi:MAG: 50S ribosomal protein L24 [Candidatus Diapherotrites archaeon]|uniref:50S ribosomal protein L24 n=1 Tax=Candidatus Iainarchaeum sp. TaxID=3101447 RepID=A0A8T3YLQ3_9ARCH|nr:50S ribosomal protein L24 [Candidatus Diapherotrites archaeon]
MPVDSFTGKQIQKGHGLMYVKKDGSVYWFAEKKSEKNFFMGRNPSNTKWTDHYHKEKGIRLESKKAQAGGGKETVAGTKRKKGK